MKRLKLLFRLRYSIDITYEILCPNHHSDFDYGLVRIDPDTYAIDHQYENDPEYDSLRTIPGHEIGTEYIVYMFPIESESQQVK